MNFVINITNGRTGYNYNNYKYEKTELTFEEGRYMWETGCTFSTVGPGDDESIPPWRLQPPGSVCINSAWNRISYTDPETGRLVPGPSFFRSLHRVTSMFIERAPYEDLVALSRDSDPEAFILKSDTGRSLALPTASGAYNRFWKMYTPYYPDGDSTMEAKYKQGVANPADKERLDALLEFMEALYYARAPASSPLSLRTPRVGMRTTVQHVLTDVRTRKGELMIGRRGTMGGMQNRPVLELLKNDAIDASWEEAWLTLWASLHDLAPIVFCCSYNFGFPVYMMESGISFKDLVDADRMSAEEATDLGASLLTLIQNGAEKGLVMSDCKPDNLTVVVRDKKMHARYIDFGSDFATIVRVSGFDAVDDPKEAYSGIVPAPCAELLTLVVFCAGVYSSKQPLNKTAYTVYSLCADRLRKLHARMDGPGKPDGMPYTLCGLLNELSHSDSENYVETKDKFGRGWRMFVKSNMQDVASTILAMAKWYGGIHEKDLGDADRGRQIIEEGELRTDEPLLPQIVKAIEKKTQGPDQRQYL